MVAAISRHESCRVGRGTPVASPRSVRWLIVICAACGGATPPTENVLEDDWSLPAWVTPAPNSGLFEEHRFDPRIAARSVDLAWGQLMPTPATFSSTAGVADADIPADYRGDDTYHPFSALDDQLAGDDPYWMRLYISDVRLAPAWLAAECPNAQPIAMPGYLGPDDLHYPIWDPCIWSHAREVYRRLLVERDLRADPRLQFVYVPGAFTYSEFDFDLVEASGVDAATFVAWFHGAVADLVGMLGPEHAAKLVYTGEDYPFSSFGTADDLLARDAVAAGMGIRTGITELFNFHLSHVPAYGITVDASGHMVADEQSSAVVRGTENECFDDCGFHTDDLYYVVKMANLKALQLRMTWLLPGAELLRPELAEHWNWVIHELGQTRATSADAWIALRSAEDRSLADIEPALPRWSDFPFVHDWSRWLVQRDVAPDGIAHDGSDVHQGVLAPENGTAIEGRVTDPGGGLYFDVDDGFLHDRAIRVALKVTYRDTGSEPIEVTYPSSGGAATAVVVTKTDSGAWRTATLELADATFAGTLADATDLRIGCPSEALELRFVRLVKLDGP
jgi:hypothetical protein